MNDEIKAQVVLGMEAENFVDTELGQNVLKLAEQDLDAAILAFVDADPFDGKRISAIQSDVRMAMKFERYLGELITRGHEVMSAIKEE